MNVIDFLHFECSTTAGRFLCNIWQNWVVNGLECLGYKCGTYGSTGISRAVGERPSPPPAWYGKRYQVSCKIEDMLEIVLGADAAYSELDYFIPIFWRKPYWTADPQMIDCKRRDRDTPHPVNNISLDTFASSDVKCSM